METSETPALLAPWLDYARESMLGWLDELATPRNVEEDLWISWRVTEGPEDVDQWMFTLEAMELLDLYVRVDYRAAWAWILDALGMPLYLGLLDELPHQIFPKHTISWTDLLQDGSSVARAQKLVFAIPQELHSAGFPAVKAEMMKRWNRERRDRAERIRVCLELVVEELNEDDGDGAAHAFRELEDLAALVEDPSRRGLIEDLKRVRLAASFTPCRDRVTTEPSEIFWIQSVEVITGDGVVTDPMLKSLRAIARCGIQVLALTIDRGVYVRDLLSMPAKFDFLRALVVPDAASSITTVSIDSHMETTLFEALCSALSVTQSVKDVRVGMPNAPSQYWSWIAYALLSGDVSNSIQCVHLRVEKLTADDAAQIERVLRATDPIAALAPPSHDSTVSQDRFQRERTVVDVRPNTACLVGTDSPEPSNIFTVAIDEPSCTNLRVVDDVFSRTHICILYPGAGLCWVHRDAIVAQRRLPHFKQASPHEIELEMGHQTSLPALLVLVRLLGPHTRVLKLFALNNIELTDEFLRDVLAACPHLERLELTYVKIPSFAWLTENSNARLASLRIRHVESLDANGYKAFFAALRNSEHGLGCTLRELALRDYIEDLEPLWPDILALVAANRQLERLLVRPRIDDEAENLDALTQQLGAHNGELLPGQAKPFPLRSQLALLSVFAHSLDFHLPEKMVLATIFAMAAPNKRRVCGIVNL